MNNVKVVSLHQSVGCISTNFKGLRCTNKNSYHIDLLQTELAIYNLFTCKMLN
jgi:hypothetical protein